MSRDEGLHGSIRRERRRGQIIALAVTSPLFALSASFTVIVFRDLGGALLDGDSLGDNLIVFMIFGLVAVMFWQIARWTWRFIFAWLTPPRTAAMWLRGFQAEGDGEFRTSRVIDRLGSYGISTITLQDRDVQLSLEQRANRMAPIFWGLGLPAFILFAMWFVPSFEAQFSEALVTFKDSVASESVDNGIGSLIGNTIAAGAALMMSGLLVAAIGTMYLLLIVTLIYLVTLISGPVSTRFRRNRDDFPKLPNLLQRMDKGRRQRGSIILRVDDDHWHEAVRLSLAIVKAVIIDISDVSKAIVWEIEEAVAVRGRRALVFIAASDAEPGLALPVEMRATIHNALGKDLSEVNPVIYPAHRKSPKREQEAFAQELREELYRAVDGSRDAEGS